VLWTIGHSTRTFDELFDALRAHGVTMVADVRKLPRSRRHPQFSIDVLPATLSAAGLRYVHLPGLGGLRRGRADSINRAWRNPSFRAYADYMQTEAFAHELDALLALAARERVAIMCAEALWWRCHRSLIADVLVARRIPVYHIMSLGSAPPHQLREWARVRRGRVTYPVSTAL